jgi:hypothetical protein
MRVFLTTLQGFTMSEVLWRLRRSVFSPPTQRPVGTP